ncbi:MAG: hypothetical protein ACREJ3_03015, partial [Polyangiaceae bacterium]
TQCSGVTPQTCNATGSAWTSGMITAGKCGALCTPNAVECAGTTSTQTCGSNGQWGTPTACSANYPTCCGGTCVSTYYDDNNCGACGHPCAQPNPFCSSGTCQCYVSLTFAAQCLCGGTCYNLSTQPCAACTGNPATCPNSACN